MNTTDKQLERLKAFVADFAEEKIDALTAWENRNA